MLSVFLVGLQACAPFLSEDKRVTADVLVVEGWIPDYALKGAVEEFRAGHYRYIITAGGPLLSGYYLSGRKTYADLAAATLSSLGVSSNLVVAVPGPDVARGRTLAHARAVQEWLEQNDGTVHAINVFSLGVHARRTRMTFQSVFKKRVVVGIISHPDRTFDCQRWWSTSQGFKTVLEEAMGYGWYSLAGVD